MTAFRSRWTVPIERELVDSGVLARVGTIGACVYFALRTQVRTRGRSPEEQARIDAGAVLAVTTAPRIAACFGLHERSVRVALAALEAEGWVRWERSVGGLAESVFLLGDRGEIYVHRDLSPDPGSGEEGGHRIVDPVVREGGHRIVDPGSPDRGSGGHRIVDPGSPDRGSGEVSSRPASSLEKPARPGSEDPVYTEDPDRARDLGRPIRRVKRDVVPVPALRGQGPAGATPPPPPPARRAGSVVDPDTGRELSAGEYRHLLSARAKQTEDRRADWTADELVAGWRSAYYRVFGVEDVDLSTETARKRAARLFTARTVDWVSGERGELVEYLFRCLDWWARSREVGADFPRGLPALAKLLERKPGGEASFYFKHWRSGGMRDDLKRQRERQR